MALSLPVSAGAPYQTYTYSIYGTALYSPDAYTPAKTIDSTYMGLDNPAVLQKYYPELYGSTKSDDIKKLEAKKTLSSPADIEVFRTPSQLLRVFISLPTSVSVRR